VAHANVPLSPLNPVAEAKTISKPVSPSAAYRNGGRYLFDTLSFAEIFIVPLNANVSLASVTLPMKNH
jgi:hypothetical protein